MTRQTEIQTTNANAIEVNSSSSCCGKDAAVPARNEGWSYVPVLDAIEAKDEYTIVCDAPGLSADQIELTFDSGVLHLHGAVPQRYPQHAKLLRQEYGVGDFHRSIPLGRLAEFVDGDRITAQYETGVLTITLPKLAAAQGRRIDVKSN